ncbi:hypothetical protein LF1_30910 [Rubripirellula obstinata]|uniref:PEP-CTERM protein-sorting domain-containing protein n=1 Tax=Rubripirellula obstinata TaxID=406547 RepID=A0A5B1CJU3_9BACT|nr:PEP-CTERM sorting domain-containing protein [Rubripirellula obstinata]KAA1260551.1 hypothetical protein LF1_30910 [Rubripirellula obstinata]
MQKFLIAIACSVLMNGGLGIQCQAALVAYDEYSQYQAALGSATESVINFDTVGSGVVLGSDSGVTFSAVDSNFSQIDLVVYETDPVFNAIFNQNPTDTISGPNYVGRELLSLGVGNFSRTFENEIITLTFDSPRSAVGLFVIAPNNSGVSLTANGQSVNADFEDPIVLAGANQAFFIGLIDDSGANSISSATLQGGSGGMGYHFDDLTTSVTAIPEPNSLLAFGVLIVGVSTRRRRLVA